MELHKPITNGQFLSCIRRVLMSTSYVSGAGETNTSHVKFYQVCRDFQNVEDAEMVLRSEGCAFTTGEIPFLRWKTEILSTSPYVVLYYDFVTEREATTVVNKAMDRVGWMG